MAETAAEEIKAPESVEKKLAQKSLTASFGEVPTYEFIKTLIASEKATTGAKEILKDAEQTKLDEAIKQTNTPNEELTKIINNPTELAKLTKEEINKLQERFKTLNKWDIIALGTALEKVPDGTTKESLKKVLSTVIDTMMVNGFSIENDGDVSFLMKNGKKEIKDFFVENFKDGKVLDKYDAWVRLILQWTDTKISLNPAIWTDGKLLEWLDITKLNTIDTKADAKQIENKLKANGINMADMKKNFSEAINSLMNSNNPMMKGLAELFKFFGKLFGFGSDGNIESKTEKLDAKWQKKLLESMGKNDKYNVSAFFDAKWIKSGIDTKGEGFQQYMRDTYTLLGKELPKDPKQILEYDDELKKEVRAYEKSIDGKETGLLTQARIGEILKKLDDNGTDAKKEESKEKPAEKHKLSDLVERIKGDGNFKRIKKDTELVRKIQEALWTKIDWAYGKKTTEAVRKFQTDVLWMPAYDKKNPDSADGKIWPKTIQKMEEWNKAKKIESTEKK